MRNFIFATTPTLEVSTALIVWRNSKPVSGVMLVFQSLTISKVSCLRMCKKVRLERERPYSTEVWRKLSFVGKKIQLCCSELQNARTAFFSISILSAIFCCYGILVVSLNKRIILFHFSKLEFSKYKKKLFRQHADDVPSIKINNLKRFYWEHFSWKRRHFWVSTGMVLKCKLSFF